MANRERIPPLLAPRGDVLTTLRSPFVIPADAAGEKYFAHRRERAHRAIDVNVLKASIRLYTILYLARAEYIAWREERRAFSYKNVPPKALFVPIRNDSEMVFNTGPLVVEAGLLRPGVTA